ncbi:hypothetical protein MB901379_04814 [Mycobacterium basiliense]|uniref:Exported repetitive protein n=1 Tax=Mycobacterium basiliense TaxID=2094119 RepID=A0A447GL12_9MYCO|nr:hypothetical protein [Mycobacterium basiliense]VDM91197.1 hypothetical protein MB901379_04814 [Mycobacterium basiliense]
MPNRRRRKLSTAMSAVAALAVASPCAYFLVYESTEDAKPTEHHDFVRAASVADLPTELMTALSQGLSSFGINLPPVPSLTGSGATGMTSPGLTGPGLYDPGLAGPGLTSPGLTSPGLTSPGLTSPGLTSPGLTSPGLTTPGLTPSTPGSLALPGTTISPTPGAGVNPALTSPTGLAPGLTSPTGLDPALGGANEIPITTPAALDPGADGTYPILGDPTLGYGPATSPIGSGAGTGLGSTGGGGGLLNDVMQAANQLGAGQAIDLLKGVLMPSIMQAVQSGGAAAPAAATPELPAVPAVPAVPAAPAAAAPVAAAPAAAAPAAAAAVPPV